jgi:hypothetical protein
VNLVSLVYGQPPGVPPSTRPSTGVQLYLPSENRILPDYSMIQGSQFYDVDIINNDGVNDALYCQSANNSSNIGVWYYPNGTQVPLFTGGFLDSSAPNPIFSKRFTGQIALARRDGLSGIEGLYTCIIPDENGTDHTLVVGIYRTATYNSNDGPDADPSMMFSLISTRDANPPVFTLSFNVSDGPPTDVTCTDGTNPLTITSSDLSRVIVNGPGSVTQVTVTVRMRQAGTYQCTVSNDRVTAGTIGSVTAMNSSSSLSVTVAGTPSGVTATRLNTGLAHVRLSWSSVSGVVGYEVFYQPLGGNPMSVANITTNTMVDITSGLSPGVTYNLFVVSYGDGTVLPSDRSTTSNVTLTTPSVNDLTATTITSTSVSLTWSHPSFVPQSYSITRGCHRLCDSQSVTTNDFNSISSPYESSGINPGSECSFTLRGIYGSDQVNLDTKSATTLSSAPTSSVSSVTISSVEARSMRVSWGEVPCNGQNGPITGYWLYYTNTTFNDSVNITGGDMREYILTSLAPYTNYSVRVRPYNDGGIGPTSNEIIQQTSEDVPGVVSNLVLNDAGTSTISISWDVPSIPNGIITVYEIHYTNGSGTYNTTNTQYTIEGLLPNTLYTIEVRAYTSAGAGEWRSIVGFTFIVSTISSFTVTHLNITAVKATWQLVTIIPNYQYNVYYMSSKSQTDIRSVSFPGDTTEGVIGGLDVNLDYTFAMSVTLNINGVPYEGERTPFIPPGANFTLIPTIILPTTTTSISTSVTSTSLILTSTYISTKESTSTLICPLCTCTISSDNESTSTGPIVGVSLLSVIVVILLVVVVIETSLLIYYRRHTTNPTLKSSDDIDMTTSPAYGTTVLTSTGPSEHASVETIYDTVHILY